MIAALRDLLCEREVLFGSAIPPAAMQDWLGLPPTAPLALVRPRDTAEVAAVVRTCREYSVAIVPQGGRTGLAAGAHPVAGAIALSTERLTGPVDIDPDTATAIVGAGTPLAAVQDAAEARGLMFPLDLGARGSCTIGGVIGTNAGGNRVVRYGMTRDLVLGLEAVLADGSVVGSLGRIIKNNTGYDLRHLMIGSEGTLGLVTRAVLRLQPAPLTRQSALCGLDDFSAVLALLRALRARLGPALTAFEVMWPSFYDFMADRLPGVTRPLGERHGIYVLVEACGFDPGRDEERFETVLGELMGEGGLRDAALARTGREIAALWAVREGVSQYGRLLGPIVAFDIGFAIGDLQRAVDEIGAGLGEAFPGLVALFYGHIGDGNLHVVTHLPGSQPQPAKAISGIVYRVVERLAGTVSAEHGIGLAKKAYLRLTRSDADLAAMHALKQALDPQGLFNPGKLIDVPGR